MAHLRKRYLTEELQKLLRYSPLVGVTGHRQVGKTTLIEAIAKEYTTLDDKETLRKANKFPKEFIKKLSRLCTAIDECQMAPPLFPALKEWVRVHKQPGQFILSGSVRFTSRKAIRESLTGRIINLELLPFSIAEIQHLQNPTFIKKIIQTEDFFRSEDLIQQMCSQNKKLDAEIATYLTHGGLPSIFFTRDLKIREKKISDQLLTILDRDIRLVNPTLLTYHQILDLLQELAKTEGEQIRHSDLQKSTGISTITIKKLLFAFEAIYLIRSFPVEGGPKGPVYYFEDQAEVYTLDKQKNLINQLAGLLYRNIRTQVIYNSNPSTHKFFQYRTRGGARIPICLEWDNKILGFLCIEDETPNRSETAMASSFLKKYGNGKVVYTNRNLKAKIISSREAVLPLHAMM